MRTFEYTIVDVFTKTRLQGNPLAVFTNPEGMTNDEMQRIAGEMNLAESIFLFKGAAECAAVAKVFTPRREMDFAGHPTVGGSYVLAQRAALGDAFSIRENVGLVPIERTRDAAGDDVFWLTTPPIAYFETLDRALGAQILGLAEADVSPRTPPQFVSAGSPLLFVELNAPEIVDRAEFSAAHAKDAIGSVNAVGVFLFARKSPDSEHDFDVYSRMFAPHSGIPEDPATGGATGPLAAYMLKYGRLPTRDLQFVSEQGVKMGRRSLLDVKITAGDPPKIQIGGSAVTVAEGRFFLGS